jgi:hypothetical protein
MRKSGRHAIFLYDRRAAQMDCWIFRCAARVTKIGRALDKPHSDASADGCVAMRGNIEKFQDDGASKCRGPPIPGGLPIGF